MRGNSQVRFLGEGVVAMSLPYPTYKPIAHHNFCQPKTLHNDRGFFEVI